jgi:hypothetical protein
MTYYYYSNLAIPNTIGNPGGISNSAVSMYLTTTPSGYPSSFPFKLRLDPDTSSEEIVKVTAGAGTSGSPWTISRHWDSTTAVSHGTLGPAVVAHGLTQEDLQLSRDHEALGSGSGVHGLPASAWAIPNWAVIGETTIANTTTTVINFSSIPGTYKNLFIVMNGRGDDNTQQLNDIVVTVNGDTSALYSWATIFAQNLTGVVSGPNASETDTAAGWKMFTIAADQSGDSHDPGGGWAVIPNYVGTTFAKTFTSQSGFGRATTSAFALKLKSGLYKPGSQAAITALDFTIPTGHYKVGTFVGLYGFGG